MNNFKDIENIWKQAAPESLPDVEIVIAGAKKETRKLSRNLILNTITLVMVIPVLIFVLVSYPFQVWTSYAGLSLMFICIFAFAWYRVKDIRFLKNIDYALPPAQLLDRYRIFYKQQQWINAKLTLWYTLTLNIAFLLYFFETLWLSNIPYLLKILIFVLYLIYLLLTTLVISKKYAQRQEAAIGKIISSLETEKIQLEKEG